MVGNAGTAIMFACFLVGSLMVGLCVFAYVSHCLLVVLETTAAGADEVAWPDDTYVVWMGEAPDSGLLVVSKRNPGGTHGQRVASQLVGQPTRFACIALHKCESVWLYFPVAALSCLSASCAVLFFRLRLSANGAAIALDAAFLRS